MITPEKIQAFLEYVIRPLTDDIRQILEKLKELNLPISEKLITDTLNSLIYTHITTEIIRWITYVTITSIVCYTVVVLLV